MGRIEGEVLISAFGEVELANALELRLFRKEITARQAKAAAQAFEQDLLAGVFRLQAIPSAAFEKAKRLARQHTALLGTRSLDLIHVATALTLGATGFLSFDTNQRKLAHEAGLTVAPKTLGSKTP